MPHTTLIRRSCGQSTTLAQRNSSTSLTADQAMRLAWRTWMLLLAVPFVLFFWTIWRLIGSTPESTGSADHDLAGMWFLFTLAYLAMAVPAAFFWRNHLFRDYLAGGTISPRQYLEGMMTVWVVLAVGGVIAILGCILTNTLVPNVVPGAVALVLYMLYWPSGRTMSRPLRNEHDPAEYEDPR